MSVCTHEQRELRHRITADRRRIFIHQCLDCGYATGQQIAANKATPQSFKTPFDEELLAAKEEERRRRWDEEARLRDQERSEKNAAWWDWYNEYLQSAEWNARRLAVLRRDHMVCQACLKAKASQAHHLNYDHVGEEPLFDLVAVCFECHDRIHEIERERKAGAA